MPESVKVAVVDDHPIVRRGVRETFAEDPGFEVAAEGASAADAIRIAHDVRPDLFVLDVTMPGGGLEAAVEIIKIMPSAAILMLSIREDLSIVRAAMKAGVRGYISKGIDGTDLVECARRVVAGERYLSPQLGARLIAGEDDMRPARSPVPVAAPDALSAREAQILELLKEGMSNLAIAERLGLSENTVKHYMTPLLQKLGARNRTEAALIARARDP